MHVNLGLPISYSPRLCMTVKMQGSAKLPSKDKMWKNIEQKRQAMAERYVDSTRHTIQVDYVAYMDDVAEEIGCKPDLGLYI